jgi:hypothetical protein
MSKFLFLINLSLLFILVPMHSSASYIDFSIEKGIYNNLSLIQQQAITSKVQEINQFFETNVYSKIPNSLKYKLRKLKVTISFSDKSGRDALFVPNENGHVHKIFIQLLSLNSNGLNALLAHEFFHAVHYEINPDEDPWVREGMAQVFEYIVTDELNGTNLRAAIENPHTPLIGTYSIENPNRAQYGHDMLYFYYLYKRCGGDSFFWSLAEGEEELKGAALINSILGRFDSPNAECKSFSSSAVSFEVAKIHNQVQELIQKESEGRGRFFLAPTNLTPKYREEKSSSEIESDIAAMPLYSSEKYKLPYFLAQKIEIRDCVRFYAKRTFPYEISENLPSGNPKNYDIILVKTKLISVAD